MKKGKRPRTVIYSWLIISTFALACVRFGSCSAGLSALSCRTRPLCRYSPSIWLAGGLVGSSGMTRSIEWGSFGLEQLASNLKLTMKRYWFDLLQCFSFFARAWSLSFASSASNSLTIMAPMDYQSWAVFSCLLGLWFPYLLLGITFLIDAMMAAWLSLNLQKN